MKKLVGFVFLGIVASLLVACGGGTSEEVRYDINMTEYAFAPENLEFKVGQVVTLDLINSGQLQHEVMFGRDVRMTDNRPPGYQVDMFEVAGVEPEVSQVGEPEHGDEEEMHEGFMVALPEDGTGTIKFTVTEGMVGEWEMGCFEQDGVHYDAGMKGTVTITN